MSERTRPSIVIAAFAVVILVGLSLFEGAARLALANDALVARLVGVVLENDGTAAHLDPYEMADPRYYNHWRLRPGFEMSLSRLEYYKEAAEKFISFDALQRALIPGDGDQIGIRVNEDGFKGPPLRPGHDVPRILAVGDSTTFGTGPFDYPLFMQQTLNEAGIPAEVVNGGVEGYRPRNMILELDRFLAIKPDMVLINAGWNALFNDYGHTSFFFRHSESFRLVSRILKSLRYKAIETPQEAMRQLSRPKTPDPDAPEVTSLNAYEPPSVEKIASLAEAFADMGAMPVILTLPGLYTMSIPIDERALRNGHLPVETDNPYVLAKLTERYNEALRRLARDKGYRLVDLAAWSFKAFDPRSYYFTDSVHLAAWGLDLIGNHLAAELAPEIIELGRR